MKLLGFLVATLATIYSVNSFATQYSCYIVKFDDRGQEGPQVKIQNGASDVFDIAPNVSEKPLEFKISESASGTIGVIGQSWTPYKVNLNLKIEGKWVAGGSTTLGQSIEVNVPSGASGELSVTCNPLKPI